MTVNMKYVLVKHAYIPVRHPTSYETVFEPQHWKMAYHDDFQVLMNLIHDLNKSNTGEWSIEKTETYKDE